MITVDMHPIMCGTLMYLFSFVVRQLECSSIDADSFKNVVRFRSASIEQIDERMCDIDSTGAELLYSLVVYINELRIATCFIKRCLINRQLRMYRARYAEFWEMNIIRTLKERNMMASLILMKNDLVSLKDRALDIIYAAVCHDIPEVSFSADDIRLFVQPIVFMKNVLLLIAHFSGDQNLINEGVHLEMTHSIIPRVIHQKMDGLLRENHLNPASRRRITGLWPARFIKIIRMFKNNELEPLDNPILVERDLFNQFKNDLRMLCANMRLLLNGGMDKIIQFYSLLRNENTTDVEIFRFLHFGSIDYDHMFRIDYKKAEQTELDLDIYTSDRITNENEHFNMI